MYPISVLQINPRLADVLEDGLSSVPRSEVASDGSLEEFHHESELQEKEREGEDVGRQ